MNYFIEGFKKAFDFNGRASRTQYWMFTLFCIIISFVLYLPVVLFAGSDGGGAVAGLFGLLYMVWALVQLIPGISIAVRRLHDTARSGWWVLIMFVPIIGGIWFLILMCLPSKH